MYRTRFIASIQPFCNEQDGEHQCEDATPKYTEDQLKLMQSQDVRYVNFKRSLELKVSTYLSYVVIYVTFSM